MDDTVSTYWDGSSTSPTVTVTVDSGSTHTSGSNAGGNSNSLSSGVVAAIVVVSVLVLICVVTAARLHLWWCMNLRCKVCLFLRCGRRKLRKGVQILPCILQGCNSPSGEVDPGISGRQTSQALPGPSKKFLVRRSRVEEVFSTVHR